MAVSVLGTNLLEVGLVEALLAEEHWCLGRYLIVEAHDPGGGGGGVRKGDSRFTDR